MFDGNIFAKKILSYIFFTLSIVVCCDGADDLLMCNIHIACFFGHCINLVFFCLESPQYHLTFFFSVFVFLALKFKESEGLFDMFFLLFHVLFFCLQFLVSFDKLFMLCIGLLQKVDLLLAFCPQHLVLLYQNFDEGIHIFDIFQDNKWKGFDKEGNIFLLLEEI